MRLIAISFATLFSQISLEPTHIKYWKTNIAYLGFTSKLDGFPGAFTSVKFCGILDEIYQNIS